MATLIGKKPLTNAEKQKRYRQKKNAAGLTRRETWTSSYGFLASSSKNGKRTSMSLKELEQELYKLMLNCDDWECEMVYAELFEYAKKVMPKFKELFENIRKRQKDTHKK
jgi:hypothetical protein